MKGLVKLVPLFCIASLLNGCRPSYAKEFYAGLGNQITSGDNSFCVTSVTWSDTFIMFVTEISFHEISIHDGWSLHIFYGHLVDSERYRSPFNKIETNLRNEVQIDNENILSVEGTFTFVFDQVLESPTNFINNEEALLYLSPPIIQDGYVTTSIYIQNEEVTFEAE